MTNFPDLIEHFDVKVFDTVVSKALDPNSSDKKEAEEALIRFKEHPDALIKIDGIMTGTQRQQSRFIAMQILEENVRIRWSLLTEGARSSVRQYVFNSVVSGTLSSSDVVLQKFNTILIEIAKKDWPQRWRTFISDLISISQGTSMAVASNTLRILRLMNEQVFMLENEVTTGRRRCLQAALREEYFSIFRFISTILGYSEKQELDEELLENCLYAFCSFCKSMPLEFIFSTRMVECTLGHLNSPHSVAALDCLTEIIELEHPSAEIPIEQSLKAEIISKVSFIHKELISFFQLYLQKFNKNSQVTLQSSYRRLPEGERIFLRKYARVFSSLFSRWFSELGTGTVQQGLQYFIELSRIEDSSFFSIVFPTWAKIISDFYNEYPLRLRTSHPLLRDSFSPILRSMLPVFINNMPKPTEVFIRVNDLGEIVKDRRIETSETEFYKKMKQNLFLLSFSIEEYMKDFLDNNLARYISDSPRLPIVTSEECSKLCWAVGALAGALDEVEERTFLVNIIKTLLSICEMRHTKEEKAVVASNIMFIIGQYNRFLKYNTEFLAVVVKKLFEFMEETYEGIKEMACDNFYKICENCPTHLYTKHHGITIFDSVLEELPSLRNSLDFCLQRTVIEGLLLVISGGPRKDVHSVARIYSSLSESELLSPAAISQVPGALEQPHSLKSLVHLIDSYALGLKIIPQLFLQLVAVDAFFQLLERSLQSQQPAKPISILMRSLSAFFVSMLDASNNLPDSEAFLNRMNNSLLTNFQLCSGSEDRVSDSSSLLDIATAVVRNGSNETSSSLRIRSILTVVAVPSVKYLQKADENPEAAMSLLKLLIEMHQKAFSTTLPTLLSLPSQSVLMNALFLSLTSIWEVSTLSLELLQTMTKKCFDNEIVPFFDLYYYSILENILGLIFDRDMRKTYDQQVELFYEIISYLKPIINPTDKSVRYLLVNHNNEMVKEFIQKLFQRSFKNVTVRSLDLFITGIFEIRDIKLFREHLDDFNIKMGEYGNDDDIMIEESVLKERIGRC